MKITALSQRNFLIHFQFQILRLVYLRINLKYVCIYQVIYLNIWEVLFLYENGINRYHNFLFHF